MVQAIDQADDRSFSAAGMSYDGHRLPGLHRERNILQHITLLRISETHFIELYFSLYLTRSISPFRLNGIVIIQYPENSFAGHHAHLQHVELIRYHPQGADHEFEIQKQGDNLTTQSIHLIISSNTNT